MPDTTRQARSEEPGRETPVIAGGTERALAVLKELARHPAGASLEVVSRAIGAPKSSVHRALSLLVKSGFAFHPSAGRYILGPEFIRLAYAFQEAAPEPRLVEPCLQELADTYGETAHYAELTGRDIVYRAKVTPRHGSVQMTSTVGGRNPAYCTGVGKALLASRLHHAEDPEIFLADYAPFDRRTERTLTTAAEMATDLRHTHERGFALDDEESERGINCIAFPLFRASPTIASGAISVAALRHRLDLAELEAAAEDIRAIIHRHLGPVTR